MGGKEILIKSIAQAVSVFAMMVFKIPKNICKGITSAISQFQWGDDNDQKRIDWQQWWKLCMPKGKGDFLVNLTPYVREFLGRATTLMANF